MIFFTDLDKTIVYSENLNCVCVEYKDGKGITYMTQEAIRLLRELLCKENLTIIPCTLRSIEQTKRINFISNNSTPILICDNGFSIYKNGELDLVWDMCMKNKLRSYPNDLTYDIIHKIVRENNIPIRQIKSNRDVFFTIIFKNEHEIKSYSNIVTKQIDSTLYKIEMQGRKMYIIPRFLDKVLACHYLKSEMNDWDIITAGDGFVDESFLKEGNIMIIPNHSELDIPRAIRTVSKGIKAGEEILELINNEYNNRYKK